MYEPEFVEYLRRSLLSAIRVAGTDDPEAFRQVLDVLDDAQQAVTDAAYQLHWGQDVSDEDAPEAVQYSWAEIGAALGISRQAARSRFALVGELAANKR